MKCRMCHLTAQGQHSSTFASAAMLRIQLDTVLAHYQQLLSREETPVAERININFMARGDPLLNRSLQNQFAQVYEDYWHATINAGLKMRINLSTIMPRGLNMEKLLTPMIGTHTRFYYSLYSFQPTVRKNWLPNAMAPQEALSHLHWFARQQERFWDEPITVIHGCFIEGVNDDLQDVETMARYLWHTGMNLRFQIVRYNPPVGVVENRESPHLEAIRDILQSFDIPVRLYERVGFDVHASCGMFPRG